MFECRAFVKNLWDNLKLWIGLASWRAFIFASNRQLRWTPYPITNWRDLNFSFFLFKESLISCRIVIWSQWKAWSVCQCSNSLAVSKFQLLFLMFLKLQEPSQPLSHSLNISKCLKRGKHPECYFISLFFPLSLKTLSHQIFAAWVALQCPQTDILFSPAVLVILRGKFTLQQVIPPWPKAEYHSTCLLSINLKILEIHHVSFEL